MKTRAERSIEALTWASVVIWLGFALIMHLLDYAWLVLMVLSVILLSSAIYQRSRGWQTSLMIWIGGVWMAIFSVIEVTNEIVAALSTDGEGLQIDILVYLGIALVAMGLAVVLRHMQGPSLAPRKNDDRNSSRAADIRESQGTASFVPRRVAEDYSSGYYPPEGASAGGQSGWIAPESAANEGASRARPATAGTERRPTRAPQPDWTPGASREAPAPANQRRGRRSQPSAPAAQTPSDLESRVEDIIRRSRQRRNEATDDDLPY